MIFCIFILLEYLRICILSYYPDNDKVETYVARYNTSCILINVLFFTFRGPSFVIYSYNKTNEMH